jgi:hypothetical protein
MWMIGLLLGFLILGPALAWWLGMFNPIGFMGVRPWRVPESAKAAEREGRIWTQAYHLAWQAQHAHAPDPNEHLRQHRALLPAWLAARLPEDDG